MKEMATNNESRLDELESRQAFQDDLIESLNQIVARQDQELVRLKLRVKALSEKLNELADSAALPGASSGHETPPHY